MTKRTIVSIVLSLVIAASVWAVDPYAYVINSLGETLSKINLQTNVVTNDILPLGSDVQSYPNQIVVLDTLAYVICSGTNEVQVINLLNETTVTFISFVPGSNPYFMAPYNSQYAFVTNLVDNSVATVDLTTNSVIDTDSIGVAPSGIAIQNHKVWIVLSNYDFSTFSTRDGYVTVCSPLQDTIYATIPVGHNPQYIAIDRHNVAHVVCTGDYGSITGMVYRINTTTYTVIDSIPLGGAPGQIAIAPNGVAYVAAGGFVGAGNVYTYNATTGQVYHNASNPLTVSVGCSALGAYQDGSMFTVNFEDAIDQIDSSGALVHHYGAGDGPVSVDFNYMPGDFNGSFTVTITDLSALVSWLLNNGPEPVYPRWRANVNGDYNYTILDITCLVKYLFAGGPRPKPGAIWLQ